MIYTLKNDFDISDDILNSLLHRFSSTVKLSLPILAFILTGNGLRKLNTLDSKILIAFDVAKTTFIEIIKKRPEMVKISQF